MASGKWQRIRLNTARLRGRVPLHSFDHDIQDIPSSDDDHRKIS